MSRIFALLSHFPARPFLLAKCPGFQGKVKMTKIIIKTIVTAGLVYYTRCYLLIYIVTYCKVTNVPGLAV